MGWNNTIDVPLPNGLAPCRFCGKYCMYAEGVEDGFDNRGFLIRIVSLCDESYFEYKVGTLTINNDKKEYDCYFINKDICRTEFLPEKEAIKEWNEMNSRKDNL